MIRAYIGQGLRTDLERFESETIAALISSLKRPIARLNTWPNDEQDAIAPSLLNLIFLYTTVFISVRLLNTLSTSDSSSQICDRCN